MKVNKSEIAKAPGHWLLARMGKRVLRPGGRELTEKLIKGLNIQAEDDLLEIAPGLGSTTKLALAYHPKSYTVVDGDSEVIENLEKKFSGNHLQFLCGNASKMDVPDESRSKIFGEAILTMNGDHIKQKIIDEVARVLKKGGLYAIHEIGLIPDNLSEAKKAEIQKEMSKAIKVNARPLTIGEWKELLSKSGLEVIREENNGMLLLEPKRLVQDEGFWRTLKIAWNIFTNRAAYRRIKEMKRVFHKHQKNMNSILLLARKK